MSVGVRKQGRVASAHGPYISVAQQTVLAPEDWREQELAMAVSVGEVKRALDAAEAKSDEVDTIEFRVGFEEG